MADPATELILQGSADKHLFKVGIPVRTVEEGVGTAGMLHC
jgi:hypothetical protein